MNSTLVPRPGVSPLVIAALSVASVAIWILHASRFFVFTEASYGGFWNRNVGMFLHVVGGTFPLFIGPFLLWSGLRRWRPQVHRVLGRTYLLIGATSVGAGAYLSVLATLKPRGLYVATLTLAIAWLAAAGMAYRAIRHRRIEQHRQWVIRSYVLTLTFVACRTVMRLPAIEALGPEAIVATVWASWILPLVITEVCLQWRATGHPER
jgi:uncharacterized membrane protein